jgi:hypothetical protein
MTTDAAGRAVHQAWSAVQLGQFDSALNLCQEAVGVARAHSIELCTGLFGAAVMCAVLGDDDLAEAHMAGYLSMMPPAPPRTLSSREVHP